MHFSHREQEAQARRTKDPRFDPGRFKSDVHRQLEERERRKETWRQIAEFEAQRRLNLEARQRQVRRQKTTTKGWVKKK